MDIAKRDLKLQQIQNEITMRQQLLFKKKKDLEKTYKLNDYLKDVKDEYTNYYDFIVNEKRQQQDALKIIKEYLTELINSEQLVGEQLRSAKHELKDILKEMDKIDSEWRSMK